MDLSDIERDQLQKLRAGFHVRTGCDSTPWQGILLECFSAVLGLLKSPRKGDLPEMQNSAFVKYSVQR